MKIIEFKKVGDTIVKRAVVVNMEEKEADRLTAKLNLEHELDDTIYFRVVEEDDD